MAGLALVFIVLVHPRIGIRDWDGWSYVVGAVSLRAGKGYRDLAGQPLNRWPPGYSFVLSQFGDPVWGAQVLNYGCYALALALLYRLLRRQGWEWQPALGLTVTLGAGFFRLLASLVHAEMLTYCVFFGALDLAVRRPARTAAGIAWAALIPFKFIAVVFLPAAVLADGVERWPGWKPQVRRYLPAALATAAALAGIFVFDFLTEKTLIPAGHESLSVAGFMRVLRSFSLYSVRSFLFDWYGAVGAPFPRVAFPVCLSLIAGCLGGLRFRAEGAWLRVYGASCLLCAFLLLFVRWYEFSPRLVGYSLIAFLAGCTPLKRVQWLWLVLGAVSLVTGTVNALTVNALGSNDPRYEVIADQLRANIRESDQVATNASALVFTRVDVGSFDDPEVPRAMGYDKYLWVTLPQLDSILDLSFPIPRPGVGWCEDRRFPGAVLFGRCPAAK